MLYMFLCHYVTVNGFNLEVKAYINRVVVNV